jgi:hypothetical protein
VVSPPISTVKPFILLAATGGSLLSAELSPERFAVRFSLFHSPGVPQVFLPVLGLVEHRDEGVALVRQELDVVELLDLLEV